MEYKHPRGTIYEQGLFISNLGDWDVYIAEIGAGNSGAALEAERAIEFFNPKVVLFVGIAGGIKDVKIGDVIAATKIYGYEFGKADDAFKPRADVGNSSYTLIQRARAEARKDDWKNRIRGSFKAQNPNVFIGAIAAGEKVISSKKSDIYRFIEASYSDALAVEMEGRGFLEAAQSNEQVMALVIRGVSDLVKDKSEADVQGFQSEASDHASAFAFEVLSKLDSIEVEKITKYNMDYSQYTQTTLKELTKEVKTSIGFYIPMHLTERSLNFFGDSKKMIKNKSISAEQILSDHNHLVILGNPGSGKSSLLNQLAIDIINKSHQVPIIIKAKYWGHIFDTIPKAIEYVLKPYLYNINENIVANDLIANKYIILIDGYDEIRNSNVLFESEIISLTKNKEIKIVLTSREHNYHGELPNFEMFEINELSDVQIDKYAEHVISFKFFSYRLGELNLLGLARIPLYLFMLCSIAGDDKGLSKNKAMLQDKFASYMLEDNLFKRIPAYRPKYTLQLKLQFLSKLAEKKTIDPLYNDYYQCQKEIGAIDSTPALMQEIFEAGILKGNFSSFDFIHPTVKEFFYARLVSSYEPKEIINFLKEYHARDDFLDIILFLVGIPKKQKKQAEILDFLENNDLPLYIKCLKARYINPESTNNYSEFEYHYLSQLQRSYNSILKTFFDCIKLRFFPYTIIPLDQVHLVKKLRVQVVGYIDVPNMEITYGYKLNEISDNFEPLVMPKKSFYEEVRFYTSTSISTLDLDFAREMAVQDIIRDLKSIIDERRLKHPMNIACEMFVANIKEIASNARMFVDRSLESLWKFHCGIYDAQEYYDAFNIIKDHPYISWGTAPKRFFNVEYILTRLDYLIKNNISLKEQVLPPYFLNDNDPHLGQEMEKRLVLRLNLMYSILPKLYLQVIESNFPELQKYMRYANIYPFKCIVRYHHGIDFAKKGLIRDTLGEASVYFKPIPSGEELAAIVEKADPSFSKEEQIKLSIEYKNNLKSLGRYSKRDHFRIFSPGVCEIIDNLALSNALYKLLNEDLEWLLNDG